MGVVRTIREELKPIHEIFVCEMGARYVGEIKEDCDLVHPHHGLITSIGPQHLDTFGSLENIQNEQNNTGADTQRNGDGICILVQIQLFTESHVNRNVSSGRSSEECHDTGILYAFEYQWIWVLFDVQEYD